MRRALVFAAAAVVTSVFFINLCAAIFACGCQPLWGAADRYCNVHAAHGRHCPWCATGTAGQAVVYGSMLGAQGILVFGRWPRRLAAKAVAALAAFPVVGIVLGILFGWITEYWAH